MKSKDAILTINCLVCAFGMITSADIYSDVISINPLAGIYLLYAMFYVLAAFASLYIALTGKDSQ